MQEQLINKIMEETGANDMEDLHAKLTGNPIQSLLLAKRIYSMDWSTVENEIVESNERKSIPYYMQICREGHHVMTPFF